MQDIIERMLSQEQRMMRDTIRAFVDKEVTPFIRKNWQLEWDMTPENRPSRELLESAHRIGVRTLGSREEFGGTPVDRAIEVQTFTMVAEEISRGDSGLADKLVQIWKISKLLRDASLLMHRDATVDISRFKIVKSMFPQSAGIYAGPEH